MPVWLTLFLSLVATAGFFGTLYFAITLFIESKQRRSAPRVGFTRGDGKRSITIWVKWNPNVVLAQVYRIRISYYSPKFKLKEGLFSYTFEQPQKESFILEAVLPDSFLELLQSFKQGMDAVVTVDVRTVENIVLPKSFRLGKFYRLFQSASQKTPSIATRLTQNVDEPAVASLDYEELVERRSKLKRLADEAKAKEQKAAAAAAARAAAPVQPASAPAPGVSAPPKPTAVASAATAPKPVEE